MPTTSIMVLPKTKSAEEFELICKDVLKLDYNIKFEQYGRKGQKQDGIDLYAKSTNESYIVVQCKNYFNTTFEKFCSQLSKDIKASDDLEFEIIEKFIVMTALDRDTKVQKFISDYSAPFSVSVMFWDDIQDKLCSNKKLLKKYYSQIMDDDEISIKDRNYIISNANIIKKAIKYINENCLSYSPAYNEREDINIYNICINIFNAVSNLQRKREQYHLQLKKIDLVDTINMLYSNLPEIFDETQDGTGCSMICTILDYKKYFLKAENNKKYTEWCDKIIEKMEKI